VVSLSKKSARISRKVKELKIMDVLATFVVGLSFGYAAFIIASNWFGKPWMWFVSGGAVFLIMTIVTALELFTFTAIMIGIVAVMLIATLIKKKIEK
jgi:membrane protein YdbS with pleckstrin-like domain